MHRPISWQISTNVGEKQATTLAKKSYPRLTHNNFSRCRVSRILSLTLDYRERI